MSCNRGRSSLQASHNECSEGALHSSQDAGRNALNIRVLSIKTCLFVTVGDDNGYTGRGEIFFLCYYSIALTQEWSVHMFANQTKSVFLLEDLNMKVVKNFVNHIFLTLFLLVSATVVWAGPVNYFSAVDMMENEVILINADTDAIIQAPLNTLKGWPGGRPQHTVISSDGAALYISTDASESAPASVVILSAKKYNWEAGSVKLKIKKVLTAEAAGTASTFSVPTQVNPLQPVASWTQPPMTQMHGPSILPGSKYLYFTQWTDNKIRVVNTTNKKFAKDADPVVVNGVTDQTHGVFFNESGTLALGTGYYYDNGNIDLFSVDRKSGDLDYIESIRLGDSSAYAAFTHYNTWLDDRYAVTATMQFGPTSLTPAGVDIIPPSVWLIDTQEGSAEKILDMTNFVDGEGVLRSPSDINVGNGKLILAEEDSLDDSFGDDGFISIFDFSDRHNPVLIKRLQPGVELPDDFAVSHSISVTPDERFAFVVSYASAYILKLDLQTNSVAKVYGPEDGLTMPHGGYVSGGYR